MKKIVVILVAFAVIAIGFVALTGDDTSNTSSTVSADFVTIQSEIDAGAVIVDVRTPQEYAESHAVGAINVPLQDIQQNNYGPLKPEQKLYIYCRSGNRSAQAISLLETAGYNDTTNLVSLTNWQSLGGQVTTN